MAIIGEELGYIGVLALLLVYCLFTKSDRRSTTMVMNSELATISVRAKERFLCVKRLILSSICWAKRPDAS